MMKIIKVIEETYTVDTDDVKKAIEIIELPYSDMKPKPKIKQYTRFVRIAKARKNV